MSSPPTETAKPLTNDNATRFIRICFSRSVNVIEYLSLQALRFIGRSIKCKQCQNFDDVVKVDYGCGRMTKCMLLILINISQKIMILLQTG